MFYKFNRVVIVGETRVSLSNSNSNYGAFLHRFRARLHDEDLARFFPASTRQTEVLGPENKIFFQSRVLVETTAPQGAVWSGERITGESDNL